MSDFTDVRDNGRKNRFTLVQIFMTTVMVSLGLTSSLCFFSIMDEYDPRESKGQTVTVDSVSDAKSKQFAERFSGGTVKHVQYTGAGYSLNLTIESCSGERAVYTCGFMGVGDFVQIEDESRPIWLPGDVIIISFDGEKLVFERQEPDVPPLAKEIKNASS